MAYSIPFYDPVFNANYDPVDSVLSKSFIWAQYYDGACTIKAASTGSSSTDIQRPIKALDDPCLNIDGGVSPSTRIGYTRGLISDQGGGWLFGFHKSIGIVSPLYAELWAILTGLQLAWNKGIPRLIVQSDSMEALKLIQEVTASRSSISLVRAITTMVRKNRSSIDYCHYLDQPHIVLNPLLHRDVFGPPYCKPTH
ncbi:hypothetical protein V6N12_067966 [Hibiscus sabdariffa]|uniref:RNase H type-1 domain-containing protein n=1 Tax=Hibiscus sabdariffa TaxID=183260 RepID=A0ABR2FNL4_9ROSI